MLKLHPVLAPVKVALEISRGATVELRQVRKMGQDQGLSFPFFKENIVLTVFLCFVEGV